MSITSKCRRFVVYIPYSSSRRCPPNRLFSLKLETDAFHPQPAASLQFLWLPTPMSSVHQALETLGSPLSVRLPSAVKTKHAAVHSIDTHAACLYAAS